MRRGHGHAPGELHAIEPWHLDIGQQQIDFCRPSFYLLKRLLAVLATRHLMTIRYESAANELQRRGIVVHQ